MRYLTWTLYVLILHRRDLFFLITMIARLLPISLTPYPNAQRRNLHPDYLHAALAKYSMGFAYFI